MNRSHGHPWSDYDIEYVRDQYGKVAAKEIATKLNRSVFAVYGRAHALGLMRNNVKITGANLEILRDMHAQGCSDPDIALVLRADRHAVSAARVKIGLPSNSHGATHRAKISEGVKRQCARHGVANMAGMKAKSIADAAARLGWPEGLRLRHIQILQALYYIGPMTRRELAKEIGMPWKGTRKSLHSNDPEGSYLAHLAARGLVVNLGRIRKAKVRGGSTCVYSIPLHIHPQPPVSPDNSKEISNAA